MKMIVWAIERIFKNYITTILGILLGFAGLVAGIYHFIPSDFVWQGYNVADTLLKAAGIAVALAGAIAKDKHIGINPPALPNSTPLLFLVLALSMIMPARVYGQGFPLPNQPPADGNNLYAVGMNYSVNASPSVAGSLLYARLMLPDSKTWAFTNADFLPNTLKPLTVTNNIGAGIAQQIATLGKIPVYCITGAGVSWTGSNTGYQYNGGCMAAIKVKNFDLMPSGRFLKSSVSNGTGYQPIFGFYIGKRF